MNLLHIFKVNKRAEESGVNFADVQEAVANYDPALHEAPIVIGHPKLDDPAYGWVDSLSLAGKTVLATPKQVVQEFADWIDKGLYKKISASWYGKTNPDNPTPGKLYLKHVGYLGATPPKIKGLPDSSFAESNGEVLTLEFSELDFGDYGDRINAGLWRRFREWLIATDSQEKADELVPSYEIESLLEVANSRYQSDDVYERLNRLEANVFKDLVANYGESMPLTEQELEQREQAIALRERQAVLKEQELQFSEALTAVIAEGRVPAAERPAHLKRLKMLATIPADSVVDFAEGKENYSPTAEYLDDLKKRPVVVNFTEISETPPEITSDPNVQAKAISKRVKEAQGEGRTLSFAEADAEIRAEQNGAKN